MYEYEFYSSKWEKIREIVYEMNKIIFKDDLHKNNNIIDIIKKCDIKLINKIDKDVFSTNSAYAYKNNGSFEIKYYSSDNYINRRLNYELAYALASICLFLTINEKENKEKYSIYYTGRKADICKYLALSILIDKDLLIKELSERTFDGKVEMKGLDDIFNLDLHLITDYSRFILYLK